ncbi:hypothetical protein [Mesorhizobium sp. M1027]|uniref:hypothetical protein n=1 Tax=Mesorhizobium sp. M1027 TaxID=2957050 RepID=UPI0033389B09
MADKTGIGAFGYFKFQTETSPTAGVTGELWEISEIVALIQAKEAEKPMVRGQIAGE